MIPHTHGASTRPVRPEIAALSLLESDAQVIGSLKRLAAGYGSVDSVSALPQIGEDSLFLVHFADPASAMAAASTLHCPLFGYSTLIVSLARHGGKAEPAPPGRVTQAATSPSGSRMTPVL